MHARSHPTEQALAVINLSGPIIYNDRREAERPRRRSAEFGRRWQSDGGTVRTLFSLGEVLVCQHWNFEPRAAHDCFVQKLESERATRCAGSRPWHAL